MNRPINNDDIEMFLRSFSYTDICQELSTATGRTVQDEQYDNRVNETHPAFCTGEPSNQSFNARQHQSSVAETNKEMAKTSSTTNDKRKRTLFTPMQLTRMEEEFRQNMYVVGLKRWRLATELCLTEKQIKIWFQNRRMKLKREQVKSRCLKTGFPWY